MNLAHEDDRRRLYEFPVAKLLQIKTDCAIGNHYHKLKDEVFVLSSGRGTITRDDKTESMEIGTMYDVPAGCRHSFNMSQNSVLVCLATQPHNFEDDHA